MDLLGICADGCCRQIVRFRLKAGGTVIQNKCTCKKTCGFYTAVFESCVDGLLISDMEGRITESNSAGCQMFGYPQEEITRKRDVDLIGCDHVRDYENFKEQVRPSCKLRLSSQGLRKNGSTFNTEIYCTLFSWESQEYMLTLVRDVTNRRRAEETIDNAHRELKKVNDLLNIQNQVLSKSRITAIEMMERAKHAKSEIERMNKQLASAAEEANVTAQSAVESAQAKSNFLANMTHDLRTPMNAIIGFTDLLLGDQISETEKEYLQIIQDSGSSLLALINDILDFSKIEAGKLDIETLPTPVSDIIDSIDAMLRPMAEAKGLTFTTFCDSSIPETVETDPVRLRQCLINLLGNAIKFTKKGHVHLQTTIEINENEKWLRFDVEDTGIGIPADTQSVIFDSFSQADTGTARQFGGTGLGLAITKRLTELLGGKVSVVSEPGKGTTFTMLLPMENSKEAGASVKEETMENHANDRNDDSRQQCKLSGHVLVAEDNESNQVLAKILLEKMGLNVTVVEDGRHVLERVSAEQYDIILMDIQMPNMNGYEATEALRQKKIKIPIIALTANVMKGDEQKCLDAGCNDYLSKPLRKGQLYDLLSKYLKKDEETGDSQSTEKQADISLSLDDSETITSALADDLNLKPVIDVFIEELPEMVTKIARAAQEADFELLKGLAHQLKGASGSAGFTVLCKYVANMEDLLANKEIEKIKETIDQLGEFCKKVVKRQNT